MNKEEAWQHYKSTMKLTGPEPAFKAGWDARKRAQYQAAYGIPEGKVHGTAAARVAELEAELARWKG